LTAFRRRVIIYLIFLVKSTKGHAPKDMDDRYNKVDDQDKHDAICLLEGFQKSIDQEPSSKEEGS